MDDRHTPARKPPSAPRNRSNEKPANKRAVARLAAVQALYQMEVSGGGARDIIKEFELYRLRQDVDGQTLRAADMNWFDSLVSGVVSHQREIDKAVDEALKAGWPLARIDVTLRALMRAGVFELMHRPDVPVKVVISEYVEVAKAFFGGEEPRLVNGLLDRVGRLVRPGDLGKARGQESAPKQPIPNQPITKQS